MNTTTKHYMVGSSEVACGQQMGHWQTNPTGWTLGNVSVARHEVTCSECLAARR